MELDGFLLLDKPWGMNSTHAVAVVKRLLREAVKLQGKGAKLPKIGHAGTLDPLASGLLPLAIGEATKAIRFVVDAEKEYEFTVRWGEQRNTDDAEGVVVATSEVRPLCEAIMGALPRFVGRVMQRPPAFSAIKVEGERAYHRARGGDEVVLPERPVEIYSLELVGQASQEEASFRMVCGKGTYVRSLARDLALALGTVGYVSALRRTKVGKFSVKDAFLLVNEKGSVHNAAALEYMMPLARALADIPALELERQYAQALRHGQALSVVQLAASSMGLRQQLEQKSHLLREGGEFCVFSEGVPVGIVVAVTGNLKPVRLFNL